MTMNIEGEEVMQVFSQPLFCSNIKETRFFYLHIITAVAVINKKRDGV